MHKQPASDSGLPAQGDGAGTPTKPSTAQTPKPSALRAGQAKPKPLAKPDATAKPKPSPQAPAGGTDAAALLDRSESETPNKPQETMPASSGAKPKPPSATPAKSNPSASMMNSDTGKPAVKPDISPANLTKPKPQTSPAPKPATPVADGQLSKPGSKNIGHPADAASPASPDMVEASQNMAPKAPKPGPKPGIARPATEAQAVGTPVAQPKPVKTPAKETVEPVKSAEDPVKPTTAKPTPPKKPLANNTETKKTPDAKPTPQAPVDDSKVRAVGGGVTKPVAPSTPTAATAPKESVKPSHLNKTMETAAPAGQPAQKPSAERSAQLPVHAAQSEAPSVQNPVPRPSAQNPDLELPASTPSDSSPAPRAESLDSRAAVKNAAPALAEPDGSAPAEVLGSAPEETLVAENTNVRASSGLMSLLLGVSFVLEVALLGAVAFGAMWALPQLNPIVAILVTVVPLMILWGLFMSPKASFRIASVMHAILAHALFVGGAVLLFLAGQPVLAIGMGVLTLLSLVLTLLVGGQRAITDAVAAHKTPGRGSSGTRKGSGRRAAR